MKKCTQCEIDKEISEFYKHAKSRGGRMARCRVCTKSNVNKNRASKIDYYREFDRKRTDDPKRVKMRKDYFEKNRKDPNWQARQRESRDKYLDKFAHKRSCHVIWGNYKRDHSIKPEPCSKCSSEIDLNAHHEDYTKPLEIIWLCKKCHGLRHREINEEIRNGVDWSRKGF